MYWPAARETYDLKIFLYLALVAILFSQAEPSGQFGSGQHEDHFCEIILILDQCLRRFHLKIFFIYSSAHAFYD